MTQNHCSPAVLVLLQQTKRGRLLLGRTVFFLDFTYLLSCPFFFVSQEEVVSTAYLAAKYLQDQGFKDKVYVVGSTGITQEMDMAGIKHTDIGVCFSREK